MHHYSAVFTSSCYYCAGHYGHHTVWDVTGRDAAVSVVMSVQMLHGSIRSTLLYYLHSQCGILDISLHPLTDVLWGLVKMTWCKQHAVTVHAHYSYFYMVRSLNVTLCLFFAHQEPFEGKYFKHQTQQLTWYLWCSVSQKKQTELHYFNLTM